MKVTNMYCFRLVFNVNTCYFYRVAAHNKAQAYMKMIKELSHETDMLREYFLFDVKLIYTIVDCDNREKFLQGMEKAKEKYFKFIHDHKYGAFMQFYYLNTRCIHCTDLMSDTCCLTHHLCKMIKGTYCKEYTKGR